MEHIERCFATKDISIEQNKFERKKLANIFECVKDGRAKELFKCSKDFQSHVVKMWKSNYGQVTQQIFLGIAGLDEAAMDPCFSLALDMLLKMGIIIDTTGKGDWALAPNWRERRPIMCGDAKTAENIVAWIRKVEKREL